MKTGEDILLGQCELARTHLDLGAVTAVKRSAPGNTTSSAGAKPDASDAHAPKTAAEAEQTLIELDGEGDVVACTAVDGKVEMYRVKYVHMTLRSSLVQVGIGIGLTQ